MSYDQSQSTVSVKWIPQNHLIRNNFTFLEKPLYCSGRNITGVRIARGRNRQIIFIEGGQIGADWLSPTVVTYIVDQLVRGTDPEARRASEDYEWHIFPILNPDGHEFTQNFVS